MDNQIVITWSEAQQEAERIRVKNELRAKEKLQEFLESGIGMLDARDIGYYSEMTGIPAQELRRMHPSNDLNSMLHTYSTDNDDIFSIY